jgi:hypothetical protein
VLTENTAQTSTLIELSLQSSDIVIRSKSLELIEKLRSREEQLKFLKILSRDRYCPIAKRSLYRIAENFPDESEESLVENLIHSNKSIRETCRFYLKQKGYKKFSKIYIDSLSTNNSIRLAASILGLAETGSSIHWSNIESLTNSTHPRVRGAIVKAADTLGKLPNEWFEEKVLNGSLTEARVASEVLVCRDDYPPEKAALMLENNWSKDHLRYILDIAQNKDKWIYLSTLLTALIEARNIESSYLNRKLASWIKRYHQSYWYVKPDETILNKILTKSEQARAIRETDALEKINTFVKSVNNSSL